MKKGNTPLVVGNWKMNPLSVSLSIKLATRIQKNLKNIEGVTVVISPPFIYLESVHRVQNSKKIFSLGAQNVHHEKLGAHTGEVSIPMLVDLKVSHIILGHSERREEGETDEKINQKLSATIKAGLVGIVCVGEKKRDHAAHYLNHIEAQIRAACAGVSKTKLGQLVIAYEPIWAIGTGVVATPEDVHEMKLFIEKVLSDIYGRNAAQKVYILYGGSVSGKSAQELFTKGMVDGFLVGGASLRPEEFIQIAKSVQHI
ncbi:MAG: triose-phosphate isomerase [Candidatus Pacebacteria bacterium]|nr:triose-phosphate isomerase [Candidatus Paceibacterota bacterium]MCF7857462.1 triose-phosphate isomerase [Candidatus Paceibacterota bacterium]